MSHKPVTDQFNRFVKDDWIAGYPPWVSALWIGPSKCTTKEQTSHLLHLLRLIEDGQAAEMERLPLGIDPNLRLALGIGTTESLLEWAVQKARDPDWIRILIGAGANIKVPYLVYYLVTGKRTDLLPELLQAGADPNTGPEEETALSVACWNDAKTVRLLLAAGADTEATSTIYITNSKPVSKVTPLMIAAYAGALQIVKLLLEAGADAKTVDAAGNTALAWAKISRAKAKAAKIIPLLEAAGATTDLAAVGPPEPVDFASRAKSPEFGKAIEIAKALTKSPAKAVILANGTLRGVKAFRIHDPKNAMTLLDEIRPIAAAFGALGFLSEDLYEPSVPYLIIAPTLDYREAVIAFETPEGQSIDSYDLVAWLSNLEKTQPFVLTHLAPDLMRARFTTPLQDSKGLATAIETICPYCGDASVNDFARQMEESRELYLWWD